MQKYVAMSDSVGEQPGRKPRTKTAEADQSSYSGKAGQRAVVAEVMFRGYNAAIPEVDVGDDIWVFDDASQGLIQVQVKTAKKKQPYADGFSAAYNIPGPQLRGSSSGLFVYVFVARIADDWAFVLISRLDLQRERTEFEDREGKETDGDSYGFRLRFYIEDGRVNDVTVWGVSFKKYLNNWQHFPEVNAASRSDSSGPKSP